jgi:hypothetical protein
MDGAVVKLDDDGTWECRHVGLPGEPHSSTRLRLDQTLELNPGHPTSAPRRWTNCPDCGTYWRVWVDLRVAKPSIEWSASDAASKHRRYRRAPVLDVDRVIDLVKANLAEVSVVQHHDVWPADDEGVWFFRLPKVQNNIQIESSTGMCPFFVEHDGMPSPADGGGWNAASVHQAAKLIVGYLREQAIARGGTAAG